MRLDGRASSPAATITAAIAAEHNYLNYAKNRTPQEAIRAAMDKIKG
jgi:hypothetical protein